MSNIRLIIIIVIAVVGSSAATGFVIHNQTKANANTQQTQNNNSDTPVIRNVSENTNTSFVNTNVSLSTNTNVAPVVNTVVSAQPVAPKPKPKPVPVVNTTPAVDPAIKIELCKTEGNDAVEKKKNDFATEFLKEVCDGSVVGGSHGLCETADEVMAQFSNPQDPQYWADPVTRQNAVDSYLASQADRRSNWLSGMMTGMQPVYSSAYNPAYEACLKK